MSVRPGATEARISGIFEIASPELAARLGAILDQQLDDEPILITRRISAAGRSSITINGRR